MTCVYPLHDSRPHAHDLRVDARTHVFPLARALQPHTEVGVQVKVHRDEPHQCTLATLERLQVVVVQEVLVKLVKLELKGAHHNILSEML